MWGHWYHCFGFLVMSALGFKARVDPSLACVQWIPQIHLSATPVDLLMASMAADHVPYMYIAEVGCQVLNRTPPAQKQMCYPFGNPDQCNVLKQPPVISWHWSIFGVTNLPYPWALRGEGLITSPLSLTLEPSIHGHHLPSNFSPSIPLNEKEI